MGNKNSNVKQLVILKRKGVQLRDINDYHQFNSNDKINITQYKNFEDFNEKQSLKNLNHILIVQGLNEHKTQDALQNNDQQLPEYMLPLKRYLRKREKSSQQLSIREKIINHIKKYSFQNLNLYLYVSNIKDFLVPESQAPYITLVSTRAFTIINHILNEHSQNLAKEKFQGLMKDLYRRKLVAIISENWTDKIKKTSYDKENQPKLFQLKEMYQLLNKQKFQPQFLKDIDKFRSKLKSMYFEFVICMDQQKILQLVEFKSKMPVQSKIIYFGKKSDLSNTKQVIQKKKNKEIWLVSNNLQQQINPIMKMWWKNNKQINRNQKIPTNIIIYLCRTENIPRSNQIKQKIQPILDKFIAENSTVKDKKRIDKNDYQIGGDPQVRSLITVEFKPDAVAKRLYQSLYTNIIMYDATNQEYEQMKKFAFSKFKGEPRVQVSLIQLKPNKNIINEQQTIKNDPINLKRKALNQQNTSAKEITKQQNQNKQPKIILNENKKNKKGRMQTQNIFDEQLTEGEWKEKLRLKFQISPIERIYCINIDQDDIQIFKNKIGLEVQIINQQKRHTQQGQNFTPQKQEKKNVLNKGLSTIFQKLQRFFPNIVSPRSIQNNQNQNTRNLCKSLEVNKPKLHIGQIFENFLIICSFQDYLKYIFPFLVMANFFKKQLIFGQKKRPNFNLPQQRDYLNAQFYLKKIKIIIYDRINSSKNKSLESKGLNYILNLHANCPKTFVEEIIVDYLKIHCQESQLKTKQQDIKKYIQWINSKIMSEKKYQSSDKTQKKATCPKFPGIVFIHQKRTEIQNYLDLYKYRKLSISNFPKDSLKNFSEAYKQIQIIVLTKSFSLDATFVSNNNLLKEVFDQQITQVIPKHKMQFIHFSLVKQTQMTVFENYIKKYAGLWQIKFDFFYKGGQSKLIGQKAEETLNLLKQDVKRAFQKCKNYELLKVSASQFKHFYLDCIQKCKSLLDLQIAAIYIYSLPHGISEIISIIFEEPSKSVLSLEIFTSFLFLLFSNFYSKESRILQKISTVIYVDEEKIEKIYKKMRLNDTIINLNMLHILKNQTDEQNQKNHCVFFQYQNMPWFKSSSLMPILQIQNFSFYKESAHYIIAPFTKLRLKKKSLKNNKYYNLHFEVVNNHYDSNLFLKTFFQLNQITDISIFQALNHKQDQQQKQKTQQNVKNKQKPNKDVSQNNANSNENQIQGSSLYQKVQEASLEQQKNIFRKQIKIILMYTKWFKNLKTRLMFSAEQNLYQMSQLIDTPITNNNKNKNIQIEKEAKLKKLKIEKAMLFAKMNNYSRAINELDEMLKFLQQQSTIDIKKQEKFVKYNEKYVKQFIKKQQKTDQKANQKSNNEWMKQKIKYIKQQISNIQKKRHRQIKKMKNVRKWTITMEDEFQDPITNKKTKQINTVISRPPIKWTVSFDDEKQTFFMESDKKYFDTKYDVFQINLTSQVVSTQNTSRHIQKENNKLKQQKDEEQPVIMEEILNALLDDYEIPNQIVSGRGKGSFSQKEVKQMNALFKFMSDNNQLQLLSLLHLYMKFYHQIITQKQNLGKVWQDLKKQIPQTYIMEKFIHLVNQEQIKFKQRTKKQKNQTTTIKDNGLEDKQLNQMPDGNFLTHLQKTLNQAKFKSLQQQIFEQHLERLQNNQDSKKQMKKGNAVNKCWIDQALKLNNERKDWSVFEFQKKMIVVDAKRKWKQKINNGLNVSRKTFIRCDNEIINLDKTRKSQINNPNQ